MQTLLDGPDAIIKQTERGVSTVSSPVQSISQLIVYNSVKQKTLGTNNVPRHIRDRETPLTVYLALKIYTMTRKEMRGSGQRLHVTPARRIPKIGVNVCGLVKTKENCSPCWQKASKMSKSMANNL